MEHKPRVVNMHWYGSVAEKPEGVEYIGRPSLYGNYAYDADDSSLSREDKVALHRIWLHKKIITDSEFTQAMMADLVGKDLGCWCKNEKTFIACHGDNLLREITWLTDMGWVPGMRLAHSYGLVDEYEHYRKALPLLFPWDKQNIDFALWETFLVADNYIRILTEDDRRSDLLVFLAKAVTRLNVIYNLGLLGSRTTEKIFTQCNAICGYTNPFIYNAVTTLTAYLQSLKKKGRKSHGSKNTSASHPSDVSALGCAHDHSDQKCEASVGDT